MNKPSMIYMNSAAGSIESVEQLKSLVTGEMHEKAEEAGICLIRKGTLTSQVRELISRVANIPPLRRPAPESDSSTEFTAARSFSVGMNNAPNAFLHKHASVCVIPQDVTLSTVFAADEFAEEAYIDALRQRRAAIDALMRSAQAGQMVRSAWSAVTDSLDRHAFTEKNQGQWINIVGNMERSGAINHLALDVARDIQRDLDRQGKLGSIPWNEVDGGIIHWSTLHARDCRSKPYRMRGQLLTWDLSTG